MTLEENDRLPIHNLAAFVIFERVQAQADRDRPPRAAQRKTTGILLSRSSLSRLAESEPLGTGFLKRSRPKG